MTTSHREPHALDTASRGQIMRRLRALAIERRSARRGDGAATRA
jgi:hypothetical protein